MRSRIFSSKYLKTISKGQLWMPASITVLCSDKIQSFIYFSLLYAGITIDTFLSIS